MVFGLAFILASAHIGQGPQTPESALQALKTGNSRSLKPGYLSRITAGPDRNALAAGQEPFAIVLGCSDSRVPPEMVFDQRRGQLFVVRVAGNIVDPPTLGSVEYGVEHLHAKVVLVLGHAECGAVKAAFASDSDKASLAPNIQYILKKIHTGLATGSGSEKYRLAAIENVRFQLKALKSDPMLSADVAKKKLILVGGYYDLKTGKVEFLK
ncbi:carbonic anhydrase [soil metagenome]